LLSRGARSDILTGAGSTALHLAAAQGHTEVVKLLVQCGCNTSVLDASGCTPRELCLQNGHVGLSEYLFIHEAYNNHGSTYQTHNKSIDSTIPIAGTVSIAPTITNKNDNDSIDGGFHIINHTTISNMETTPEVVSKDKDDIENSNNSNIGQGSTEDRISSQVIHQVFSSLSITEKCALAISIARTQKHKLQRHLSISSTSNLPSSSNESSNTVGIGEDSYTGNHTRDGTGPNDSVYVYKASAGPMVSESTRFDYGMTSGLLLGSSQYGHYKDAEACDQSLSRIDTMDEEDRTIRSSSRADAEDDELQLEIQSVMSEKDVGMVMRLMGDLELSEVEREVG
jgi:hypothetical protein